MKEFCIKKILALSFIGSAFLFNHNSYAQTYELGGFIGLGLYKGELSDIPNPANFGANVQVLGRYNIDNYSTLRINIGESLLSGTDQNQNTNISSQRNTSFNSNLAEMSFIYEHNFFPYRKENTHISTTPFVFVGLGIMTFNSSGGTESGTGSFSPVIPFGIGTKTVLSEHWNLNFEFGTRKTFTDYLDNTHDEVNKIQTGYKYTYDWYSFLTVGVTYTIYPLKCP